MRTRTAGVIVLLLAFACACTSPDQASLPLPSASWPAVLTVSGRGNPPLTIEIGTVEVARLGCDGGQALTPGDEASPPLPWDLRVVRQSDGQILLSKHVTELPRWVTVIKSEAAFTTFPVAGPPGPSCAPGS